MMRDILNATMLPHSQLLFPCDMSHMPAMSFRPSFRAWLPEGPVRHELSMRFQIPQSDYLSMLERLGDECVGALRFLGDEKSSYDPGYRPLQDEDF